MTDIPPVNPEHQDIPSGEAQGETFIDPVFREQSPERLPDELEQTPEEKAAAEAEQAAAAEAKRREAETLKELIEENADDEGEDEEEGEEGAEDEPGARKAEEAAGEEGKSDDAGEGEDEEGRQQRRPRRRSRARRERRAMERQVRELTEEVRQLREERVSSGEAQDGQGDDAAAKAGDDDPRPKLEDFDYDQDQWAEALGEWTERRVKLAEEAPKRQAEAERAREEEAAFAGRVAKLREREESAEDKYEDYRDVVYDRTLPINGAIYEFILESEVGPDIAYHLAKNREDLDRISKLAPVAAARELTRIETRLAAEEADAGKAGKDTDEGAAEAEGAGEASPPNSPPRQAAEPPRRTPTRAPAPVPTVGPGDAGNTRDPSRMSQEEYEQARLSGKIR
jgi:hypothetical protein